MRHSKLPSLIGNPRISRFSGDRRGLFRLLLPRVRLQCRPFPPPQSSRHARSPRPRTLAHPAVGRRDPGARPPAARRDGLEAGGNHARTGVGGPLPRQRAHHGRARLRGVHRHGVLHPALHRVDRRPHPVQSQKRLSPRTSTTRRRCTSKATYTPTDDGCDGPRRLPGRSRPGRQRLRGRLRRGHGLLPLFQARAARRMGGVGRHPGHSA